MTALNVAEEMLLQLSVIPIFKYSVKLGLIQTPIEKKGIKNKEI